jgi:alpha-N-acetylglucosaminidase
VRACAQAALQRKILKRQREYGMLAVLPGFAGFVPAGLRRVYPNEQISPSGQWWETANASLCCNHLLRPEAPLWRTVGARFYALLAKECVEAERGGVR